MSDQYQWWRDALAGKPVEIHADEPQSGFYKMRRGKNGPWLPVAIWRTDEGVDTCRVGHESTSAQEIWTFCAGNPVSKADAKHAFEHGIWPGDVQIGHNSGDLSLAEEIRDAVDQALGWLRSTGVKDKLSMDMAANYRARLLELAKKADGERDGKVRPHLEAQREINAEYKPIVDAAKHAADTVRTALSTYMAEEEAKRRKAAEDAARIENEKRAAEYRRQQEEASRRAVEAKVDEPPPPPIEPPVLVAPETVKLQAGGQTGKRAGLREIPRYSIADYAAALAHAKDHPTVIAAVEKVCFAQARAGATVPGVSTTTEKVAV